MFLTDGNNVSENFAPRKVDTLLPDNNSMPYAKRTNYECYLPPESHLGTKCYRKYLIYEQGQHNEKVHNLYPSAHISWATERRRRMKRIHNFGQRTQGARDWLVHTKRYNTDLVEMTVNLCGAAAHSTGSELSLVTACWEY